MLRKFRNNSEDRVQRQIRAVVGRHSAELHEKVRIADIIEIEKLDTRKMGTYALQAHFDFVLVDETQRAVVAIEFDGHGHDTQSDHLKDAICRQADFPLLRIYGFEEVREVNAITLTRYLVELVFHARTFLQMQKSGQIPLDEPFTLSAFLKEDAKHIFDSEFDFICNANGKITQALRHYQLTEEVHPHLGMSHLTLRAPDDYLHAFVSVNSKNGPIVGAARLKVSLASSGFLADLGFVSAEIAQFVEGMAFDSLLENIRFIGSGAGHIVIHADERLQELTGLAKQGYTLVFGGGGSLANANLMTAFAAGKKGNIF
ncbi:DUF2726 domain-containing protein [Neorhizobium sp. CSC1952]|uniref:DUF2726 domain-containing protein n=1 Tax=Neorhizobium sp. CSC1952 TaxID=2978974 RepID=UPI0025A61D4E|nr:DUF2726 domain-containing protein [Rhizobium sp. CSC1952]WJR67102.1 DUF2726 domain-containing protein [Rhizobium sp. CSC1952]